MTCILTSVRPYFGVVSAKQNTKVGVADERVGRIGWAWVKEKRDRKPVLNKARLGLQSILHNSYICFGWHRLLMTTGQSQRLRVVIV